MFTPGEEQKHQQNNVNKGKRRQSEGVISLRNDVLKGAETARTIASFAPNDDFSAAKMFDGGRRFLL